MNNRYSLSSIVAGFLTLCFTAIVMYILFAVLLLTEKSGGASRIVFSVLNCLILFGLAVHSRTVIRLTSFAAAIQIWCATALYTIFQLGAVFIGIGSWQPKYYILYQGVVLLVYLCVALPTLLVHRKNNNSSEES